MEDSSQHTQVEQFERPLTRSETEKLEKGLRKNIIWFIIMIAAMLITYLYYINWVALIIEGIAALILFTWIRSFQSRLKSGIRKVTRGTITDIVEIVTFKNTDQKSDSYEAKSVLTIHFGEMKFNFDTTNKLIQHGRNKFHRRYYLDNAPHLKYTPKQKIEVSTDANGFNMETKKLTGPLNYDYLDRQEELVFHIKHKVQSNVPLLSHSPREIKMFGYPKFPKDEIFYFHVKNILIQVAKEDFEKYPVGSKITIDRGNILILTGDSYIPLNVVEKAKS